MKRKLCWRIWVIVNLEFLYDLIRAMLFTLDDFFTFVDAVNIL